MPHRATTASISLGSRGQRRVHAERREQHVVGRETFAYQFVAREGRRRQHERRFATGDLEAAPVEGSAARCGAIGETHERDVVHRDDQRLRANRGNRQARGVHHIRVDPHDRSPGPVPQLVADAAVRRAEIDPRNRGGDRPRAGAGGEGHRFDAECGQPGHESTDVEPDPAGNRLVQLSGMDGRAHHE